jgi:hypothetical protein
VAGYHVERLVCERKLVGVPAHHLDTIIEIFPLEFPTSLGNQLLIRVQPDNLDSFQGAGQELGQEPGAAPYVEDASPRAGAQVLSEEGNKLGPIHVAPTDL